MNPESLSPMPGKILVEIVERMGGVSRGGIIIPKIVHNTMAKDTAIGKILKLGEPQTYRVAHERTSFCRGKNQRNLEGQWGFKRPDIGSFVSFPRDVPKAWTWENKRYAIILEQEILFSTESYDGHSHLEIQPHSADVIPRDLD